MDRPTCRWAEDLGQGEERFPLLDQDVHLYIVVFEQNAVPATIKTCVDLCVQSIKLCFCCCGTQNRHFRIDLVFVQRMAAFLAELMVHRAHLPVGAKTSTGRHMEHWQHLRRLHSCKGLYRCLSLFALAPLPSLPSCFFLFTMALDIRPYSLIHFFIRGAAQLHRPGGWVFGRQCEECKTLQTQCNRVASCLFCIALCIFDNCCSSCFRAPVNRRILK